MSGTRVVVVEDDPSARGLLPTLLSADGYDVATTSAGLAGAAGTRPALLLLDLRAPDLGGTRVLEQLTQDPELAGTPVIVVTGSAGAVPAARALLGEDSVFLKPFAAADLLARVAELTGGPGA